MINKSTNSGDGGNITNADDVSDKNTDRKIHRHLSDVNDVISEDDIKNVRTNFDQDGKIDLDGLNSPVDNKEKIEIDEEEAKIETPSHPITPWDVLG